MRGLRQADFPTVWDEGDERHSIDRALVLLHHGLPDRSYAWLAGLSIGRRDAYLLQLRRATFGKRIRFAVLCPHCGERLEDEASVDELLLIDPDLTPPDRFRKALPSGWELEYRALDSRDLAEAASLPDALAARTLARRAFLLARKDGQEVGFDALDQEALAELAKGVAENDPQAELVFEMQCPACRHQWPVTFDIAVFLWQEVIARAKLLLRDVHELALRYGWSERDILELAPARRAFYMEKLGE
jgi:pimeloyl-ACP methyl ester carboxylesterase